MVTLDTLQRAGEKYGACSMRVFGSVARGDNQEGSDVDFLVAFEAGRTL